ncbi:TetR/AcrR family transcriptional regulator [Microbacterium sp. SLBN-146]|uniref:TetR/AcrR family transcriptional regulator n=1 Tax=Microbacterium sp. SLBN-146 TaxID=2768457 RepID=UPI0011739ACA|nr:TetR/AcrR family transcriptional regulator [Microbacterium sp. SLBN-146]TQJ30576.1 TetR family transcriptional regulator [Microbacterium sp. SLBN-146]
MPRPSPAETRERLLRAAAAEIRLHGYAGASLSSIAARLGMTKGSLAYHFPSKRDVALALFTSMEHTHGELRTGVADDGLRGIRALLTLLARTTSRGRTDPVFTAGTSLIVMSGALPFEVPRVFDDLITAYAASLDEARIDGEIASDTDVGQAAEDILASMIGSWIVRARTPDRPDTPPLRLAHAVLHSIGVADSEDVLRDLTDRGLAPWLEAGEHLRAQTTP